jgi:hypothetical protein
MSKADGSSWKVRLMVVAAWTALCSLLAVAWVAVIAIAPPDPSVSAETHATAVGASVACSAGCMGSVWFAGLIVGLVIYALIRR